MAVASVVGVTSAYVTLSSGRGMPPAVLAAWPFLTLLAVLGADSTGPVGGVFAAFFTVFAVLFFVATVYARRQPDQETTLLRLALVLLATAQPIITSVLLWVPGTPAPVTLWPLAVSMPLLAVLARSVHHCIAPWHAALAAALCLTPAAAAISTSALLGVTGVLAAVVSILVLRAAAPETEPGACSSQTGALGAGRPWIAACCVFIVCGVVWGLIAAGFRYFDVGTDAGWSFFTSPAVPVLWWAVAAASGAVGWLLRGRARLRAELGLDTQPADA